jgi:hypothetical protein
MGRISRPSCTSPALLPQLLMPAQPISQNPGFEMIYSSHLSIKQLITEQAGPASPMGCPTHRSLPCAKDPSNPQVLYAGHRCRSVTQVWMAENLWMPFKGNMPPAPSHRPEGSSERTKDLIVVDTYGRGCWDQRCRSHGRKSPIPSCTKRFHLFNTACPNLSSTYSPHEAIGDNYEMTG